MLKRLSLLFTRKTPLERAGLAQAAAGFSKLDLPIHFHW